MELELEVGFKNGAKKKSADDSDFVSETEILRTDIISNIEEVDVSGVVVGLLHRGPLPHDGQIDEGGRRGPLVRTS